MIFQALDGLTLIFELAGLIVLTISGITAFGQWVARTPRSIIQADDRIERMIRIELGHRVILSLELLIIADIMQTVKDPSFEELGRLAIIVLIRTALHYSLRGD